MLYQSLAWQRPAFQRGRQRCIILIYSGVHYDVVTLSPSEAPFEQATAPEEFDVTVFDAVDDALLEYAMNLRRILELRKN